MRIIGLLLVAVALRATQGPAPQVVPVGAPVTGGVATHVVSAGETLQTIASRAGADPSTIAADNGLGAQAKAVPGQSLRIDNRHIVPAAAGPGITINVPQRMVFYASKDTLAALPASVGQRGWETPTQPFRIIAKEANPTWDVPESIREEARREGRILPRSIPPGPSNPLGKYWLALSIPGVGIHGTNAPTSIYRVATHGCIRLGRDDIAWLYSQVEVGTLGRIVYEPILLARTGTDVLLEVHPDVYGRITRPAAEIVHSLAERTGALEEIDWAVVDAVIAARHGVARSVRRGR